MSPATEPNPLTIERVGPDRYAEILAIAERLEDEPLTLTALHDRDRTAPSVLVRLAAVSDGRVVGYGTLNRYDYYAAGEFAIGIGTEPEAERSGVGTQLLAAIEAICVEHGASAIISSVKDCEPGSRAFAERHGYRVVQHSLSSQLDLRHFDPAAFVAPPEPAGIRFESFADTDRSDSAMRRFFEINERAFGTEPGSGRAFEQFRKDVFEAYWFHPTGQIVAVDQGEYVGIAAVGEVAPGHFYHMATGVLPTHRGRGLAQALKYRAILAAMALGGHTAATHNDSNNFAMQAINRRLGYVSRPGRYGLRKEFGTTQLRSET